MLSAGLLDKNPRSAPSCSSYQAIRKADLSVKNSLYIDLAEYSSPGGFRFGWLFRSHLRISRITIAYTCK
jgi:hypothetical protein